MVNFLDSILDSRMPLFGRIPNSLGKSSVSLRFVMRDLKYFKIFPVFQRVLPGLATVSLQFGHNQGNMFRLVHKAGPQQYQHQPIIQKTQDPFVWLLFLRCFRLFICCTGCSPRLLYMDLVVDATGGELGGGLGGRGEKFRQLGWWLVVNWTWHGWNPSGCFQNKGTPKWMVYNGKPH